MTTPTPSSALATDFVRGSGQCHLIVTGSVLIGDAWRLREFEIDGLCSPLIIDLSGVTDLDAAGVAAVSDLARQMLVRGRGVQIVAPTDVEANRTATMTGVLDLLNRQSPVAFAAA